MGFDFGLAFSYGIGIGVGIITGTLGNIVINIIGYKIRRKKLLKNVNSELSLCIERINAWISKVNSFQQSVMAQSHLFEMIRITELKAPILFRMHNEGILYDYLNYDELSELLAISLDFTDGFEKHIYQNFKDISTKQDMLEAKKFGDFLIRKFEDYNKLFKKLREKLK